MRAYAFWLPAQGKALKGNERHNQLMHTPSSDDTAARACHPMMHPWVEGEPSSMAGEWQAYVKPGDK
jgi:hypothetical protein